MFSKPYSSVQFFGHWAEEGAERPGRRDALAVLADAVERCLDEDMRTPDVAAALDYLAARATRTLPFQQFRRALDIKDAERRWQNVKAAFELLSR